MSEAITPEIFLRLLELAALDMDQDEAEYLRRELNRQLAAIRELEAIALPDGVRITSHGVPYSLETSAPLREDEVDPCPEADDILAQAPQVEDRYVVVPDIPHTELE